MKNDFYIDETNAEFGPVVRWLSSDRIPFVDKLAEFFVDGLIDSTVLHNSATAHKIEQAASIQEYIESRKNVGYTDEEKFEMRAAFGAGETVVNIFTGEVITL